MDERRIISERQVLKRIDVDRLKIDLNLIKCRESQKMGKIVDWKRKSDEQSIDFIIKTKFEKIVINEEKRGLI